MDNSTAPQQPSFATKIKDWILSIPLFTRTIFFICIVIYIVQVFADWPSNYYVCFHYTSITRGGQVWRLFSYTIFHFGLLHILFNMMALMSLGWFLEVQLGTLHLCFTTITLTLLSSIIHLVIVAILFDLVQWASAAPYLNACGVGYSGVLFAYMILSCHYGPVNQSLFGVWSVPSKFYPWILLLITAFLFPGSSLLGHLTGIFAGYIFVYAILYWQPFNRFVKWTEHKIPSLITSWKCYYYTSVTVTEQNNTTGGSSGGAPTQFYRRPEEPDQMTEMQQQEEQNQGTIPKALKTGYRWVRSKVQYVYDKIRGRITNDPSSNPDYWAGRTDGRSLGSV